MEDSKLQNTFKTFAEMLSKLPDDNACREYLEAIRWNGIPVCPQCGIVSSDHYKLKVKGEFKGLYKCKECRERFTVTVKSMFEGSHIGLRKWFIAIYIFSSHKKGVSSHQLAKDLGVTQKSAWFMLGRIRRAFEGDENPKQMFGVISADESFVGGKNKNRHSDKKVEGSQGRSHKDKTPVLGVMSYKGDIRTRVIPNTQAETIKPIIKEMVKEGSIFITDEWGAYTGLDEKYKHIVVHHEQGVYASGAFSSNNVENFWSHLKRGIYGIYHQVSPQHLHRYCTEFEFRFNARKMKENDRFDVSLKQTENFRLTYKQLINKNSSEAKVDESPINEGN